MTDHHKFQFIMKKAFNLVSTFKNTPWYNETNGTSKKNINIEDINIQESPSVPIWEKDISDNYTDLSFGSGDISGIHTISSGNYNSNEYMSSGVHLDSTGTVALFVRLKLDKMDDPDIYDNAYAYTVYPTILSEDFENGSITTGFEYLDITSVSSIWTNASSSGIVFIKSGNSSWGSITSYKGDYHLGLQAAGTFIETTIYLMSGTYNISFVTTGRYRQEWAQPNETTPIVLNITSSGGEKLIDNYTYTNTQTPNWYEHNISFVVTTSDNMTIKFENGFTTAGEDRTVLIDAIELHQNNLLLENAYQFNYNSQINVNATIPIFKPYNYTLEYSSDGTTFNRLANSDGNWIFDNKTGIITFEENPTTTVNLDNTDLYFTFVKYLGAQGLQNLLYYKNGKVGINVSDPQSELDVLGSVSITGDLDICGNLDVDTDVLCIDSTSQRVGINTDTPTTTLDVSGSAYIDGSLNIGYGIGPGFYPIGAIIMWPTNSFPNDAYRNGFGTWLLCNGQSCSSYETLVNVIGGTTVPDFSNRYVKSSSNSSISQVDGGTSTFTLDVYHLPGHTHDSAHHHGNSINGQSHNHGLATHNHGASIGNHSHNTTDHTHGITDNGHIHNCNYDHAHGLTEAQHYHEWTAVAHRHGLNAQPHSHSYEKVTISGNNGPGSGGQDGDNRWKNITNHDNYHNTTDFEMTANTDPEGVADGQSTSVSQVAQNAMGLDFNDHNNTNNSNDNSTSGTVSTTVSTNSGAAANSGSTDVTSNINIGYSTATNITSATSGVSMASSMVDYVSTSATNKMSGYTSANWSSNKQDLQINVEPECKTAYFFIRAE